MISVTPKCRECACSESLKVLRPFHTALAFLCVSARKCAGTKATESKVWTVACVGVMLSPSMTRRRCAMQGNTNCRFPQVAKPHGIQY